MSDLLTTDFCPECDAADELQNKLQEVKEGDVVFTMECRALYEPGGCGEAVTQKTRYRVVRHPKYTELMAECLDYPALKALKELKSFGLSWEQKGYTLDT